MFRSGVLRPCSPSRDVPSFVTVRQSRDKLNVEASNYSNTDEAPTIGDGRHLEVLWDGYSFEISSVMSCQNCVQNADIWQLLKCLA